MAVCLMPFDELNTLQEDITAAGNEAAQNPKKQFDIMELEEEFEDLFTLAYLDGVNAVNQMFGTDFKPDLDEMAEAMSYKIEDKEWKQRLADILDSVDLDYDIAVEDNAHSSTDDSGAARINRIAATEMHRIYNRAVIDAGKRAGAKTKTWETMLDDKVRDTHDYMQSMTVAYDEDFYTFNGDHAPGPGQFGIPEEDINCRCFLTLA